MILSVVNLRRTLAVPAPPSPHGRRDMLSSMLFGEKAPKVYGPWSMDHGPGTMDHGPWSMDHGPWTMDHGPWSQDHGPWTMVRRPSAPFRQTTSKTTYRVYHGGRGGLAPPRYVVNSQPIISLVPTGGGGRGRGEAFPILEFALIKKHSLSLRAVSMLVITWL